MGKIDKQLKQGKEKLISKASLNKLTQLINCSQNSQSEAIRMMYWMAHASPSAEGDALRKQPFELNMAVIEVLGELNKSLGYPIKITNDANAHFVLDDWLTIVKTLIDAAYTRYFYHTPKRTRLLEVYGGELARERKRNLHTMELSTLMQASLNEDTDIPLVGTVSGLALSFPLILGGCWVAISVGLVHLGHAAALYALFGLPILAMLIFNFIDKFVFPDYCFALNRELLQKKMLQEMSALPHDWKKIESSDELSAATLRFAYVQACTTMLGQSQINISDLDRMYIEHLTPANVVESFRLANEFGHARVAPYTRTEQEATSPVKLTQIIHILNTGDTSTTPQSEIFAEAEHSDIVQEQPRVW